MNDFKMLSACNPYGLLACKIVERAILDWRLLLGGVSAGMSNMDEIRCFLQSGWCEDLLSFAEVDGAWVLNMLERESESLAKKKRMVTVDGRTDTIYAWCAELGVSCGRMYRMYDNQGRAFAEQYLAGIKRVRDL